MYMYINTYIHICIYVFIHIYIYVYYAKIKSKFLEIDFYLMEFQIPFNNFTCLQICCIFVVLQKKIYDDEFSLIVN